MYVPAAVVAGGQNVCVHTVISAAAVARCTSGAGTGETGNGRGCHRARGGGMLWHRADTR